MWLAAVAMVPRIVEYSKGRGDFAVSVLLNKVGHDLRDGWGGVVASRLIVQY